MVQKIIFFNKEEHQTHSPKFLLGLNGAIFDDEGVAHPSTSPAHSITEPTRLRAQSNQKWARQGAQRGWITTSCAGRRLAHKHIP